MWFSRAQAQAQVRPRFRFGISLRESVELDLSSLSWPLALIRNFVWFLDGATH